jgi:hypothetical protein
MSHDPSGDVTYGSYLMVDELLQLQQRCFPKLWEVRARVFGAGGGPPRPATG